MFKEILLFHDDMLKEKRRLAIRVIDGLANAVFPHIVCPTCQPAFYLPADRAGVMHAHRVVGKRPGRTRSNSRHPPNIANAHSLRCSG